ncbi:DUF6615 family protein [Streptomyces massasporeus]|uniref:DUF6615 family protein n=1 Tax=Streptomyces massasporeus TaxID=67324 RepID=UPI0033D772F7
MSDAEEKSPGVRPALVRGRTAVDAFTAKGLSQGNITWAEETATDLLLMAVHPELSYVSFNRHEEARIGADWLWWFVDSASPEAFGVLVQAKNLKRNGQRWHIDYNYKNGDQLGSLLRAADLLRVPAVYALYCGNPLYRQELWCDQTHDGVMCTHHPRAGVSVLPAMLAAYLNDLCRKDLAAASFARGGSARRSDDVAGAALVPCWCGAGRRGAGPADAAAAWSTPCSQAPAEDPDGLPSSPVRHCHGPSSVPP